MLEQFGTSLFVANGPIVSFYSIPYPTRMALAKLADGSVWVWSPVRLSEELFNEVQAIGPVRHIVSPNKIHHLFLQEWKDRWPEARMYAPPGLVRRIPTLDFDTELGDDPEAAWDTEIDQVIFHGSFAMEEVVFFHRPSSTAIFCDLIQRHPESQMTGWKGMLMRLDGLVGEKGSTPREWRASFTKRKRTRAALETVLGWNAECLLIAHGECAAHGASKIIETSLGWI